MALELTATAHHTLAWEVIERAVQHVREHRERRNSYNDNQENKLNGLMNRVKELIAGNQLMDDKGVWDEQVRKQLAELGIGGQEFVRMLIERGLIAEQEMSALEVKPLLDEKAALESQIQDLEAKKPANADEAKSNQTALTAAQVRLAEIEGILFDGREYQKLARQNGTVVVLTASAKNMSLWAWNYRNGNIDNLDDRGQFDAMLKQVLDNRLIVDQNTDRELYLALMYTQIYINKQFEFDVYHGAAFVVAPSEADEYGKLASYARAEDIPDGNIMTGTIDKVLREERARVDAVMAEEGLDERQAAALLIKRRIYEGAKAVVARFGATGNIGMVSLMGIGGNENLEDHQGRMQRFLFMQKNAAHELSHFYYWNMLTNEQRDEIVRRFKRTKGYQAAKKDLLAGGYIDKDIRVVEELIGYLIQSMINPERDLTSKGEKWLAQTFCPADDREIINGIMSEFGFLPIIDTLKQHLTANGQGTGSKGYQVTTEADKAELAAAQAEIETLLKEASESDEAAVRNAKYTRVRQRAEDIEQQAQYPATYQAYLIQKEEYEARKRSIALHEALANDDEAGMIRNYEGLSKSNRAIVALDPSREEALKHNGLDTDEKSRMRELLLAEALRLAKEGKTQLPRARELYALARPLSDEEMPEELENYILISAENAAAQIEANEAELEQAIAEIDAKIQQIQQNRQMLPMFAQMQGADDGQLQQMLKQVEEEEKKLEQQKTLLETEERKKVEGQKTALTAEANELYRLVRSLRPDWRLPLTFAIYMKKRQALKDAQNDTQMGDNAAKAKDFGQAAALYADAIRKTEEGMRVETVPFRKEQARKQLARLHSLYARSLYRIGRRDEALAAYEKAVGLGAEGLPAGDNLKAMLATRDQAGQLVRDLILKARNENNEVLYDLLVNLVMDFARAKETTDEARNLRRSARWVLAMTLNTDWWDVFTPNFEEKAEQWQFVGNALIPLVRNADGTLNPDRAQIALVIAESGKIDGIDESSYLYRNAKALAEGIEMLRTEEETRRAEQVRTRTIENMSAAERNVLVHGIIKRSGLNPAYLGIQDANKPPAVQLENVPMAAGTHARVFRVLGLKRKMVLKEVAVGQEETVKKTHLLASGMRGGEVIPYGMVLDERGHAVEIDGRLYILQVEGLTVQDRLKAVLTQPNVAEDERIRQAGEIVTQVAEHINRLADDNGGGEATSGLSGTILDDMGYDEEDSERVGNFDFAKLDEIGASEEGKSAMEDVWLRLGEDLNRLIAGLPGISDDTKDAFSLHLQSALIQAASLGENERAGSKAGLSPRE